MADEITPVVGASPETPKPKIWGAWATIGLGLAIGLLYLAAQMLVVTGFLIAKMASGPIPDLLDYMLGLGSNGLVVSISIIVSAIACCALIVLFVRIHGNKSVAEYIGLKNFSWKTFSLVVLVLILTYGVLIVLEIVYISLTRGAGNSVNSGFMTDAYNSAGWLPLLWIALVVFAPIFEEAFFRGFLFVGLQYSRIGAIGTILFTSLVWAALHRQYDVFGMATVLVLGIALGTVRLKTRSLWSSVLMHSLWNFVAMLMTTLSINAGH
jgi:membrane protease YdiL (CAAX protease family)